MFNLGRVMTYMMRTTALERGEPTGVGGPTGREEQMKRNDKWRQWETLA